LSSNQVFSFEIVTSESITRFADRSHGFLVSWIDRDRGLLREQRDQLDRNLIPARIRMKRNSTAVMEYLVDPSVDPSHAEQDIRPRAIDMRERERAQDILDGQP
jgi:hypothetical protein